MTVRVGIVGYGNLGRGVEYGIGQSKDLTLTAVYSRRDPASVQTALPGTQVRPIAEAESGQAEVDVMILCGGSKDDLLVQGPQFAALYNTVDSFDTHAKVPEYYAA